ncbi:thioredoxin reductase (NADPH) [Ruminococcus flavefaciens]|uniref:Thioredoxin reductase n=1 Tax=Ruminococcus flavefaciens TaxID=1265 RepID=A0A1H6J250_RUMFL|nr:thioredoxin-disulfide reductase [Ruminococcus flavefaciens]SEH52928.1 thioredoxin reductase (NADPH) [Ruminococcus flavefaciens]
MYDVIILGSGPAGLSAAVYASRAGLSFAVIEKDYMGTGQIAYTEQVDNYLGYYGIDGFSLGEKFREHAEALGTEFIEGEVTELSRTDSGWKVALSDGNNFEAKTVIYALGASPKKLGIAGEEEFAGRGVSYCALCDGAFFEGKTVTVIGGGDTALSDALYLSKTAEKVYVVHRRNEFRANASLVKKAEEAANIEFVLEAVPTEIIGAESVTGIKYTRNGTEKTLGTDGVFAAVGSLPNTSLLKGTADLDERGYVMADESCITSAEGLFAAGDVRTKAVRQVITAAADGANAAVSALNCINDKY